MHEHSDWLKYPTFNSPPTEKKEEKKRTEKSPYLHPRKNLLSFEKVSKTT